MPLDELRKELSDPRRRHEALEARHKALEARHERLKDAFELSQRLSLKGQRDPLLPDAGALGGCSGAPWRFQ